MSRDPMMDRVSQYVGQKSDNMQVADSFLYEAGCTRQTHSVLVEVIVGIADFQASEELFEVIGHNADVVVVGHHCESEYAYVVFIRQQCHVVDETDVILSASEHQTLLAGHAQVIYAGVFHNLSPQILLLCLVFVLRIPAVAVPRMDKGKQMIRF